MDDRETALWRDQLNGLPPDAAPAKRPRGRPPKAKPEPEVNGVEAMLKAIVASLVALLKRMDFAAAGTFDRYLLLAFRDTSWSEAKYDAEFRTGGNAIGPTLAAHPLARNTVDVVLAYGDRDFKVVAADFAKRFQMPDRVEYGEATMAETWFPAIPAVVDAYQHHLATFGLSMKGVCVVMATDGRFQGEFAPALEEFREWQRTNPKVVVVPAGFGEWVPEAVEKLSINVKPIHVTEVSVLEFLNVVAKSVREATGAPAGEERAAILAQLARMKQE